MRKKEYLRNLTVSFLIIFLLAVTPALAAEKAESLVIHDFGPGFDVGAVETNGAKVSLTEKGTLRIKTEKGDNPGITLKAPDGHWDLSGFLRLAMEVHNAGEDEVAVLCRVDNEGATGWSNNSLSAAIVEPGETETLKVLFKLKPLGEDDILRKYFAGMNGIPGGHVWHWSRIDPSKVNQLMIYLLEPKAEHVIEIDNIRATDLYSPPSEEELKTSFFPFIDTFGQYMHKDWPGKTHSLEEMARHHKEETADFTKHPGPVDWNKYGGWEAGPKLMATGHFRVEKYKGKWWLVDPEGRLFFSHGIDCINMRSDYTGVTDREHYFSDLPDEDSPLGQFYGEGTWAPQAGYGERVPCRTFKISSANMFRKYGPDWKNIYPQMVHRRLRSWGMNTIANWSEPAIYLQRKTPYVVNIGGYYSGAELADQKFPDVFDDRFQQGLQRRMESEKDETAGDPWCIGYFVDNELSWGNGMELPTAVLKAPAEQEAKKEFIKDLKGRYETIEKLNAAWGTNHARWEALAQCREAPDEKRCKKDLELFLERVAERYFRICREEVKRAAPDNLYLGCRFHVRNPIAIRVSGKYCDVISYNAYSHSVRGFGPPEGVDKPIIIGEFHFGALDRGPLYPGLRDVSTQDQRGKGYRSYVRGALENPHIVGTHWFQYKDQATTGRPDGENCQVGFLDICDTPYPETVAACREVGYSLYKYRLENN